MEWLIQYRIKGDTEIYRETVDLEFERKRQVISWWKKNRNVKKDRELINCSNNGELNIVHTPLQGMDLALKTAKENSLSEEFKRPNTISFMIGDKEVIKMEKDAFYYKGEKVEDVDNVYERFCRFYKKLKNN